MRTACSDYSLSWVSGADRFGGKNGRHKPRGHEMVVVHMLDKGLDLGALLNSRLAHGTSHFPRVPVNSRDFIVYNHIHANKKYC